MSSALYNLAVMTVSGTPGTGTITLGSAATINGVTYLSFAAAGVPDGQPVYYSISDTGASEVGLGTYTASGTTLTRGAITSTNSNNAINASSAAIVRITPVTSQFREVLTAARTYYVRADGSDSNTGLANTAGGAFLTIQKALNTIGSIDMSIYQVTVSVNTGTYTGAISFVNYLGTLPPILQGNTGTPSNVVINVTSGDAITADDSPLWVIQGFQVKTTTSGVVMHAKNGGKINFNSLDFAASADIQIWAEGAASITATGNYTISGAPSGNGIHMIAANTGYVNTSNITVTLTGTPAFSGSFANASRNGTLQATGVTYSGSATGVRYVVSGNGVIYTGGGASYFPGNAAGSQSTGGQYI